QTPGQSAPSCVRPDRAEDRHLKDGGHQKRTATCSRPPHFLCAASTSAWDAPSTNPLTSTCLGNTFSSTRNFARLALERVVGRNASTVLSQQKGQRPSHQHSRNGCGCGWRRRARG